MKPHGTDMVSVLAWPRGWDRERVTRALVESIGMDPADASLLSPVVPPAVFAILEPAAAKDAVRVLREHRVPSLAVSGAELASRRPALLAKRLIPAEGAPEPLYMVEPWRGDGRGIRMRDVFLMVRGRIPKFTKSTSVEVETHGTGLGYGPLGMHTTITSVTDMKGGRDDALDLYTESGPPVRITGRFDFAALLGKDRGYSDGENMDRLAVRLAEQAPAAEIDLGFKDFKPPKGMSQRLVSISPLGTAKRDDSPLFDFYSAWRAVVSLRIKAWRDARQ